MFDFLKKKTNNETNVGEPNVYVVMAIRADSSVTILGYTFDEEIAKEKRDEQKALIINDMKCKECVIGKLSDEVKEDEKHISAVTRLRKMVKNEIKENPEKYECANIKVKVKTNEGKRYACTECHNMEYNPNDITGVTYFRLPKL